MPPRYLCLECRELRLDQSFEDAFGYYESIREGVITRSESMWQDNIEGPLYFEGAFLVHKFGDRLDYPSECSLCTFFRSMRVQPNQHQKHKLLAFCSSEGAQFCLPKLQQSSVWNEIGHTVFMAVVPDPAMITADGHGEHWLEKDIPAVGAIYRLSPWQTEQENMILRARQVGAKVDFAILREWHSFCHRHHDASCQRNLSSTPITHGFRVIVCNRDTPVIEERPWGVRYAALSYVWGAGPAEDWPKTVLDAVTVTRELGLRYLWVDRLCINQNDSAEKDYLIRNMATIYEEASFTIVGAAGDGASYGLPGVSTTLRKPQPAVELDSGSVLVSTLPDPRHEIARSVWSTRGWTYQEGILSKRRLVFTDHQVYWECRCMALHESIHLPMRLVHEPSGLRMGDFMLAGMFPTDSNSIWTSDDGVESKFEAGNSWRLDYGFPVVGAGTQQVKLRGLEGHMRAFSARELSYDGDSLSAFMGITSFYGTHDSIKHFLGLPVWTGRMPGGRPGAHISFAMSTSWWYHRSGGSMQMFVSEPCRRRAPFPSWTWLGWKGTVSWRCVPGDEHSVVICSLIECDSIDMQWAADISLRGVEAAESPARVCLAEVTSMRQLLSDVHRLMVVQNPMVLRAFNPRISTAEKNWSWRRIAGRTGRDGHDVGAQSWDADWRRLAGLLCSINMSVQITQEEWSEKHRTGEFVSILMFAGRTPSASGHGRASFMTLRQVPSPESMSRWERVGTMQLQMHGGLISSFRSEAEFLQRLPVNQRQTTIVIQ